MPKLVSKHCEPFRRRLLPLATSGVTMGHVRPVLYPFWFIKVKAFADRPPFKAKERRHVLYLDGMSGQHGLTNAFPHWEKADKAKYELLEPVYDAEAVEKMRDKMVEKFILKPYLLKRPTIEIVETSLLYIPYYLVSVINRRGREYQLAVNSLTGEVGKR